MNISIYKASISEAAGLVKIILCKKFEISDSKAETLFNLIIKPHFDNLKASIWLLAENNYVDKVYRDSYYHYFSSKLKSYHRNCIKISLFDGEVQLSDFSLDEKHV